MSIFEHPAYKDHESVHVFHDIETGLRAIIAVHSTRLGPSAGGCRLWTYCSESEAFGDVLNLARGMSYKNAVAGLNLGGGKAVILKPEGPFDRPALFAALGRAIDSLSGRYFTAEDVGVSPDDMRHVRAQTAFVAGLDEGENASGDPSPVTADGVFRGLKVAVKHRLDADSLKGLRVAVQGLGHVGYALCQHLHWAGADLIVTDINSAVLDKAKAEFGAAVVAPDAIFDANADVLAPCALGGAINSGTIDQLKMSVIAGAANNQLKTPEMGAQLAARGILYAPDYVINAGGIMNVAAEIRGRKDPAWIERKLAGLADTLDSIFTRSKAEGKRPEEIADKIAEDRMTGAQA